MRSSRKLRAQYRAIVAYTGLTLAVIGGVMLLPLATFLFRPGEMRHTAAFLVPALLLVAGGVGCFQRYRSGAVSLSLMDGSVVVVASWLLACLFSAWPLMAVEGLTFTEAVFEAVSGWTTTGLSVVDVTRAAHITLIWRSVMQLVGGAGFAIIMLAAFIGPIGPGLSSAEGRTDQLVPHVRQSARIVLTLYLGYTIAGIVAYLLVGMTLFDAVNHAFAAVSTGGFSTHVESIGYWNSAAVEAVTIMLMLLGNLNFFTAYLLVRGRIRAATRSGEVRLVAVVAPVCIVVLLTLVVGSVYPSLEKSLRVAVFETITALTTTGFSTVSYLDWNPLGVFVLTILMIIGGGTCSTAGGLKQYRVFLLAKTVAWELRRSLLPQSAVVEHAVWQGDQRAFVRDHHIRQIAAFAFLYLATLALGTAILAAHGYALPEALFEYASAQGTVGLSLGVTSPSAPRLVLWTETAGMFLGRLEFFVVFISIAKVVRDLPGLLARSEPGRKVRRKERQTVAG